MSAIVWVDDGELWRTNQRAWRLILEEAMGRLDAETRDDYEWYANTLGVDFSEIGDGDKRRAMAAWLLGVAEDLKGDLGASFGWDTPGDRAHFDELSQLLRDVLARTDSTPGEPQGE